MAKKVASYIKLQVPAGGQVNRAGTFRDGPGRCGQGRVYRRGVDRRKLAGWISGLRHEAFQIVGARRVGGCFLRQHRGDQGAGCGHSTGADSDRRHRWRGYQVSVAFKFKSAGTHRHWSARENSIAGGCGGATIRSDQRIQPKHIIRISRWG